MTNGRRLVRAFTFKLGQKLQSAMETIKICSKCVGSTINADRGFHCSSVLRLFEEGWRAGGACLRKNVQMYRAIEKLLV